MSDLEFYYAGQRFNKGIPLREIAVDYDRDNDPNRPLPTIHEITIKNNTDNIFTDFMVETNLPPGTFSVENIPTSLYPYKSIPIRLIIYGRRLFETRVPEKVRLDVIYKETMKRS